jgi:hypothetical protein
MADDKLTEALAIIERMCVEHDVETGGTFCGCTLCERAAKLLSPKSCCKCGFAADGMYNGAYYCARCLERVTA